MNIDTVQDFIEKSMTILLVCHVVTTGVMYLTAKVRGYNPVGIHVKSKWDFNLNLKFFSDLQKNYIFLGKPKVIPLVNVISLYGLFVGFLSLIATEFLRYY